MDQGGVGRKLRGAFATALLVACGGMSGCSSDSPDPPPPPLPDCDNPLPEGTDCFAPGAHCGGPCSNSWQADSACKDGTWQYHGVARCGPNAAEAPQCRNSFESGALTPCCPPTLDCRDKLDGYPGFGCTPGDPSFCSCACYEGEESCGC